MSGNDPRLPFANFGAYVDHLNIFNTLMNTNGVPIYAISVQNEPDIGGWTDWTPAEILTFVKEFGQDIDTRVLAAESFNFNRSYTDPVLNDSAASTNVDIISGHICGNGLYDYTLARSKGKPVWMTEHLTGSFRVESGQEFSRLEVLSLDGKILMSRDYGIPGRTEEVNLQLNPGLSLLRATNGENIRFQRLVVH